MTTEVLSAITVRPADASDMPLVSELARRIWPVVYPNILTPEQIENMLERIYSVENLLQEMAQGHRFWITYNDDGQPVGYVSAYRENADIIWIKKIYVDAARQGRGIGQRMMDVVVAAFKPARELRLLVNPHNTPAHRYYAHHGFTKIGEVPVRMGDWNFNDFLFSKPI